MKIKLMQNVFGANKEWAEKNRVFARAKKMKILNLIGSPGAGKTSLLETTIDLLKDKYRMGVIVGDLATAQDAKRLAKKKVPVCQINTGAGCHLNAKQINVVLNDLFKRGPIDILFVENVGNLVCPAEMDLGEDAKVAVLSVTEGHDKISKYPLLFSEAGAFVMTKMDMHKYTNFDIAKALRELKKLNKKINVSKLDSLSRSGFDSWLKFLAAKML